ncbi:MAG: Uma2 family endonuclease [Gammaproteobacteria bacterium]|nr:Uma2 family endonuclease [Gammaproteobacteria bacterium]
MGTPQLEDLPHYTWNEYQLWEGHWELINGLPYAMSPAPNLRHQEISQQISYQLVDTLKKCPHFKSFLPVDWKIADDTIVQPDNSIVCGSVEGQCLTKAPMMIFEILSASTAKKDKTTKYKLYESNHVKYYCIVDPVDEKTYIFQLINKKYQELTRNDAVVTLDLGECEISFNFNTIWD